MTRDEVKALLGLMTTHYSNFRLERPKESVDAWYMFLQEYSNEDILMAYKIYITSNSSGFAPSISQLIGLTNKTQELADLNVSEAWARVRKAIGKGAYNSKEEFEKLPQDIQRAVGSAEQLHYWATDEHYNDDVVMSIFSRNYQAIQKRETEVRRLPIEAKQRLEQIRQKALTQIDNNAFLIGQKADKLQEGDFNYEGQQRPDNETLGHYAEQLRERLGVE